MNDRPLISKFEKLFVLRYSDSESLEFSSSNRYIDYRFGSIQVYFVTLAFLELQNISRIKLKHICRYDGDPV